MSFPGQVCPRSSRRQAPRMARTSSNFTLLINVQWERTEDHWDKWGQVTSHYLWKVEKDGRVRERSQAPCGFPQSPQMLTSKGGWWHFCRGWYEHPHNRSILREEQEPVPPQSRSNKHPMLAGTHSPQEKKQRKRWKPWNFTILADGWFLRVGADTVWFQTSFLQVAARKLVNENMVPGYQGSSVEIL